MQADLPMADTSMSKMVEGAADTLAADMAALRDEIARLAAAAGELLQERTQAGGRRVAAAVGNAGDRIAGAAADVQDRAKELHGDVAAGIARHPFAALLIVLGVGVALGMMRRGHR